MRELASPVTTNGVLVPAAISAFINAIRRKGVNLLEKDAFKGFNLKAPAAQVNL